MLTLTTASARRKAHEAVDALVDGRHHDLMSWASGLLQQQQQRIQSFTEGHEQQKQEPLQDRLSDFLLLSCEEDGVARKQDQQELEEQERYILQWVKETKSNKTNSTSPGYCRNTTLMDNSCETSPVFQRSFDSEVEVEMGMEKKTTILSRTLVLVFVAGQTGVLAQSLEHCAGVVLAFHEDEKEATWKFHGIVCVPRSEERLVSQGWKRMQEGAVTATQPGIIVPTIPPVTSTNYSTQEQQYQKTAVRYCGEEDEDSDDDYWDQYGDPDSDHDDPTSGDINNDSCATEVVFSPLSSPADTTFSPASTYHYPATSEIVRSSTAISTSTAVNTIFTTLNVNNSDTYTTNFTSKPNNCRWDEVDEVDEDDDDEYWGKYGDHDEPESKRQQGQGQGQEYEQDSEVPLTKDSSHANHGNTNDSYDMGAERQKIHPLVPTAQHQQQKQAHHIYSEEALPHSAFPAVIAPVPVIDPGQVDPTALTLRLMNLIVHHADPTGYAAAGVHKEHQFYSHEESDDIDIDDQHDDNEANTDDNNGRRGSKKGGFLIRLDSRLQQCVATPLESEFEYQSHTNHIDDKDKKKEGEEDVDIPASNSAFQEYLDHPSDNNNISSSKNNACTSLSEHKKKEEREHFLRSLRSMAQEAKILLGLTKSDFLDILDRAYDSPVTTTTITTPTAP
ncbi:hypothetical protein BGZ47_000268 [Haplosporangium gracile]|nr:hypothetical protein BGZ47_000268 [Haplosporangium gracile]